MNHDLIEVAGAYISLTAIHAISEEPAFTPGETPIVHIDYGHGSRLSFEGDAATVMKIIDAWCGKRQRAVDQMTWPDGSPRDPEHYGG